MENPLFARNELVFVRQGKFPWWPAYVVKQTEADLVHVCFGFNPRVREFGKFKTKFIVKMRTPGEGEDILTQFYELQEAEKMKKKKPGKKNKKNSSNVGKEGEEKKKPIKRTKLPTGMQVQLERAHQDLAVWVSHPDKHERHCLCQMLDDGNFMFGCEGCQTCWFHPDCLAMDIPEEVRARPELIPAFDCPFVHEAPKCGVCVAKFEATQVARRTALEQQEKKASMVLKRARDEQRSRLDKVERRKAKRRRKAVRLKRLEEDPDETETESSSCGDTTDEKEGWGANGGVPSERRSMDAGA